MKKIIWGVIPAFMLILAFTSKTSHTITGTVTDPQGITVAAVSVKLKGSSLSVLTDAKGAYSITVPAAKGTLVFSYVGYDIKEVAIDGKSVIDVSLTAALGELEEVLVVGNTGIKKQMAPGSTAQVYSRQLKGRVAGLSVSSDQSRGIYQERRDNKKPDAYSDTVYPDYNTEDYDAIVENPFQRPLDHPLSTFSIDVDAASYSNVRRYLNMGQLPPAGSVRIEEMINYFSYDYAQPGDEHPFAFHTEMSNAPWNPQHKLVLIGLQGKKIPTENLPASNLVFLIDVSGSMNMPNKLPLVQSSLKLLTDQLRPQDKVAMVVYAGAAGVVLQPTDGNNKQKIKDAIDKLEAGGSTAGGAGIRLAYKLARESFVSDGNNRVILCSDGDFNVGESSDASMEKLIEEERKSGVFLTVLGYGMGNYKDNKMQKLADKGNGNHAYIDGLSEARKVLVNEFGGTLFTIAKDVKLQIEFNPSQVQAYRLIGYENRMLASEDFNDDKKDAGELGSGHTVTALYEIIPAGVESSFLRSVDPLKYQADKNKKSSSIAASGDEWMTIKFRYKKPDGDKSILLQHVLTQKASDLNETSENFRFAAAVAEMGLLLRSSEFKGNASFDQVIKLAKAARGKDEQGYRAEFIRLVENAGTLAKK